MLDGQGKGALSCAGDTCGAILSAWCGRPGGEGHAGQGGRVWGRRKFLSPYRHPGLDPGLGFLGPFREVCERGEGRGFHAEAQRKGEAQRKREPPRPASNPALLVANRAPRRPRSIAWNSAQRRKRDRPQVAKR